MIDGNARKIIARLQPMSDDKAPNINVPTNEPMLLMLPNHETWELVSGPDVRGVSSDNNSKNTVRKINIQQKYNFER